MFPGNGIAVYWPVLVSFVRVKGFRSTVLNCEKSPSRQPEPGDVLRAKSFLFFYGLQDRFGAQTFDAALRHMLDARSERGFNLDDLIASLEQESHQNAAEFVRLWMKRPGVPADFRSRYETAPAATSLTKESIP